MAGYVRAAQRREQLLDAAVEVLVRDGLAGLTLRDVASQAGVRLSTLQYIFASRADLVAALAERVLREAGYGQFEVGAVDSTMSCADSSSGSPTSCVIRPWWNWRATSCCPGPVDGTRETDQLPAGRPILVGQPAARFLEIAERSDEEYDVSG